MMKTYIRHPHLSQDRGYPEMLLIVGEEKLSKIRINCCLAT